MNLLRLTWIGIGLILGCVGCVTKAAWSYESKEVIKYSSIVPTAELGQDQPSTTTLEFDVHNRQIRVGTVHRPYSNVNDSESCGFIAPGLALLRPRNGNGKSWHVNGWEFEIIEVKRTLDILGTRISVSIVDAKSIGEDGYKYHWRYAYSLEKGLVALASINTGAPLPSTLKGYEIGNLAFKIVEYVLQGHQGIRIDWECK